MEVEYIENCLKNHEYMMKNYQSKYMDLQFQRKQTYDMSKAIRYGEKVKSFKIVDPVFETEQKLEKIDKSIARVSKEIENLERVTTIFDRMVSFMPLHYRVVDEMVYSDKAKIEALKKELKKGHKAIAVMKQNLYKAISEISKESYDNNYFNTAPSSEIASMISRDLWKSIKANE